MIYLPSCHSTNDIAAELVRDPATPEGTVVITDEQTKGKGQRGTTWFAESGKNLTFSVILKPGFIPIADQFVVSQAIAVAVSSYLRPYAPDVSIKWPNDIYIGNRKVCGTLIENTIQGNRIAASVAGIGVNINQINFADIRATSLAICTGRILSLTEEFEKLMREIDATYLKLRSADGRAQITAAYLESLYDFGVARPFRVKGEILSGVVTGISSSGEICIQFGADTPPVTFGNKEVEWVWE